MRMRQKKPESLEEYEESLQREFSFLEADDTRGLSK